MSIKSSNHADTKGEPKNGAIMRFESEFYKNFID